MDDDWDARYRTGSYTPRSEPSALLVETVDWADGDRALDIATGTGRNAIFLAERGFDVDAIDISTAALSRARERARGRGVDVNWIQGDLEEGALPDAEYDLVCCSFFHTYDRLSDVKARLASDGVLLWEHYLRTTDAVDRGPDDERFLYGSNDLLRMCVDLTVLRYSEAIHVFDEGERAGKRGALVRIVARNSSGGVQSYPPA